MAMFVLSTGLFAFASVAALHAVAMHCLRLRNPLATLLRFYLVGFAVFVLVAALDRMQVLPMGASPWAWLHALLLYVAVALGYCGVYSAVECDSPSLTIVQALSHASPGGMSHDQLTEKVGMHLFLKSRLDRMAADGMLTQTPDGFRPAPKGLFLLRLVLAYRQLLGINGELG